MSIVRLGVSGGKGVIMVRIVLHVDLEYVCILTPSP